MRADQERVRKLLTEAVTLLCRNSLQYQDEVTVEGLIGVTLDKKDIFLVSIKETIENTQKPTKRSHDEIDEVSNPKSPNAIKRQKHLNNQRRNSCEETNNTNNTPSLIQPKQEPHDQYISNERLSDTSSVQVKTEKVDINENDNFNQNIICENSTTTSSSLNYKNHEGQNHDRIEDKDVNNSYNDSFTIPGSSNENPSSNMDVTIKKETEDPYFVIDSDEEYDDVYNDSLSDNSRSNPGNFNLGEGHVMSGNWQSGDTTLELVGSDADLLGNSQFQRGQGGWQSQFDISQLAGTSNNMLPDGTFSPGSQFGSPQDPNQRNKRFNCNICNKGYKYANSLREHIIAVHDRLKFKCPDCEKEFPYKKDMERHRKTHMSIFQCLKCLKVYTYQTNLRRHMKECMSDVVANYENKEMKECMTDVVLNYTN